MVCGVVCLGHVSAAGAQVSGALAARGFWELTQLASISFEGATTGIVQSAAADGFELSGGEAVDLKAWYSPKFPNVNATFLTQVSDDMAIAWGGSLGEVGQKYRIGPGVNFGLSWRQELGPSGTVQFDLFGSYGSALREVGCLGDYGAIGGMQAVNCRLAASVLPPEETLAYLWDLPPQFSATVRLTYRFVF